LRAATATIVLWRPESIASDWVCDARFSPDGRAIATAGADAVARNWDIEGT
jgi:WD40 repeat protein